MSYNVDTRIRLEAQKPQLVIPEGRYIRYGAKR